MQPPPPCALSSHYRSEGEARSLLSPQLPSSSRPLHSASRAFASAPSAGHRAPPSCARIAASRFPSPRPDVDHCEELLCSSRPSPSSIAERRCTDQPPLELTGAPRPPSRCPLPPLRLIDAGSPSATSVVVDNPGEPPFDPSFTSNQSTATPSCSSRRPPPTSPPAWPETAGPPSSSRHGLLPYFTVGCQPRDRLAHES
jgi:hypothetical protein